MAAVNVEAEFRKPSRHPVESGEWTHDPREDPAVMPRHVSCSDCHSPHAVTAGPAPAPLVSGRLRGSRGVSIGGGRVNEASFEYEVCLKCHGVKDAIGPGIARQDAVRNIRLKVSPGNPSYHPIAAAGKNARIVELEPGWSASSVISCMKACGDSHHDRP